MGNLRRTKNLHLNLSPEELRKLRELADVAGLTMSAYLRGKIRERYLEMFHAEIPGEPTK